MTSTEYKWLPHLENAVPSKGYGNRLSMYLIALEAWRRGLNIRFFRLENPENKMLIRYSIGNENEEYRFESSRGEKLTSHAYEICENKDETKKVLAKAGIPVPEGKRFKPNQSVEEIIKYTNALGYPVVIKPISENAGKGVFSNIETENELRNSLDYVRNELNYKDIIVEKHIEGIEHRLFIVKGKLLGAVNRVPANIVGDGKNTIDQLIKQKNRSKKYNPNLSSKIIQLDKEVLDSIKSIGYNVESVPKKGEKIFLRSKSNVSMGGDPIDVTDELTDEMKNLAIKAANSIPGLDICGLDMIIDKKTNTGVVIEINTKPMIGLHVFPVKGIARDVVSPIIDYYFPETIDREKTNLYFDFDAALAPLKDKLVNEIEILPPPTLKNVFAKCYTIKGSNVNSRFRSFIRLEALKNNIHGYVKEIGNKKAQVIVASENKKKVDQFKGIFVKRPENGIDEVLEQDWSKPVKIGFEIFSTPKTKRKLNDLRKDLKKEQTRIARLEASHEKEIIRLNKKIKRKNKQLKKLKQENFHITSERDKLREDYLNTLNSRSWKLTKPLRKMNKFFK